MAQITHRVSLHADTKSAIAAIQQYGQGVVAVTSQVEKLERQLRGDAMLKNANNYVATVAKMGGATNGLATQEQILAGATRLTAAEKEKLNVKLTEAIGKYRALGQQAPSAMVALAQATERVPPLTERLAASLQKVDKAAMEMGMRMQSIGTGLAMSITAPIAAVGVGSVKMALDFESSFAGVRKTVDATEEQFAELASGFRGLSKEIPISVNELNRIGEAAGQLGIKSENILGFTRVVADLAATTNLSSDEASNALARLANITQMPQKNFDRLGATIVELGNRFASNEAEIVEYGLRIAGAGHIAGLTEAQILAIGTAMSSVGVEAEAGGTAVQKVLMNMTQAVAENSGELQVFARTAGMSAREFARAFKDDAGSAFAAFVTGLGQQGDKAFGTLQALNLEDQRLIRAFISLAGAGDLLTDALQVGTKAWEDNKALTDEAGKRYATVASQLQVLWNRVSDVAITLGTALLPTLRDGIDVVTRWLPVLESAVRWFAGLPEPVRLTTIAVAAFLAALGPAIYVLGQLVMAGGALAGMLSYVLNPALLKTAGHHHGAAAAAHVHGAAMTATAGQATLLTRALATLGVAAKTAWASVTGPVVIAGAAFTGLLWAWKQALDRFIDSWRLTTQLLGRAAMDTPKVTSAFESLSTRGFKPSASALDALAGKLGPSAEDLKRLAQGASTATVAGKDHAKALKEQKEALEEIAKSYIPLTHAQAEQVLKLTAIGIAHGTIAKALQVSEVAVKRFADAIKRLNEVEKTLPALPEWLDKIGRKLGDDIPQNTQKAIDKLIELERGIAAIPGFIDEIGLKHKITMDDLTAGWGKWQKTTHDIILGIPKLLEQALTGGGGFGGFFKALASQFGAAFGKDLFTGGLGDTLAKGFTKLFGASIGQALGAVIPGIGQALGAMAGSLFDGMVKGLTSTNAAVRTLIGTALGGPVGGILAYILGPTKGRKELEEANKEIEKLRQNVIATYGDLDTAAKYAKVLGIDLKAAWGHQNVAGLQAFNNLLNTFEADQKRLQSALEKYGLTWENLGATAKQLEIDRAAKDLIEDFRVLTTAGADTQVVLKAMSGEYSKLVQAAKRTGSEIPAAMKPILQQLVDMGALTDENGQALASLENLTFAETLTQGFDRIVNKLDELMVGIGAKLPEAFAQTTNALVANTQDWQQWAARGFGAGAMARNAVVGVNNAILQTGDRLEDVDWTGWADEFIKAADDAYDALKKLEFGESPGGLKEIPILFRAGEMAARQWATETIRQVRSVKGVVDQLTAAGFVNWRRGTHWTEGTNVESMQDRAAQLREQMKGYGTADYKKGLLDAAVAVQSAREKIKELEKAKKTGTLEYRQAVLSLDVALEKQVELQKAAGVTAAELAKLEQQIGALLRQRTKAINEVEQAYGVSISKELGEQIAADAARFSNLTAGVLSNIADVLKEAGGTTAETTSRWAAQLSKVFDLVRSGTFSAADATKALDAVFPSLVSHLRETGGLVDANTQRLLKQAQAAGLVSKEMAAFVSGELKTVVTGATSIASGLVWRFTQASNAIKAMLDDAAQAESDANRLAKDSAEAAQGAIELAAQLRAQAAALTASVGTTEQERFDRVGRLLSVGFAAALADGQDFVAVSKQMAPALSDLATAQDKFGLAASGSFKELLALGNWVKQNDPLASAVSGLNQMLTSLHNIGQLGPEAFADITAEMNATFQQMKATGLGDANALRMLAPTLQTIWRLQQDFGYQVDAATQGLLDQAMAANLVGEAQRSEQERLIAALGTNTSALYALARTLGATTPPGFAEGTGGKFLDFGAGTLVTLHGRERVQTEREAGRESGDRASVAALQIELQEIKRLLREQPKATRIAMQEAVLLAPRSR